jgi:hypothetical protein
VCGIWPSIVGGDRSVLVLPYYLLTWELDLLRVLMKGNVVASVFLNEDIHDTKRLLKERVKGSGIK